MSDIAFEVQTALVKALTSSSSFTTSISNRLYDNPPDNLTYPYVVVGDCIEIPFGSHSRVGRELNMNFTVYTKPYELGSYEAKNIRGIMDSTLNMKRFQMESTNTYEMVICKLDSYDQTKNKDIISIDCRYNIIVNSLVNNQL